MGLVMSTKKIMSHMIVPWMTLRGSKNSPHFRLWGSIGLGICKFRVGKRPEDFKRYGQNILCETNQNTFESRAQSERVSLEAQDVLIELANHLNIWLRRSGCELNPFPWRKDVTNEIQVFINKIENLYRKFNENHTSFEPILICNLCNGGGEVVMETTWCGSSLARLFGWLLFSLFLDSLLVNPSPLWAFTLRWYGLHALWKKGKCCSCKIAIQIA
jgi:hypothetical protein